MNTSRRLRAEPSAPSVAPGRGLHFCAVCQVSIASSEIESGEAQRTQRGRTFCGVCAKLTPVERARRRDEIEAEFADDAPVMVPFRRVDDAPPPLPPVVAPPQPAPPARTVEQEVLDRRIGELERSAFRLQARVASLEEKLDAMSRRLG
jgi:hypothetical protein